MIDNIINYLTILFSNGNKGIYWDQYGIYDIESGLMYEYFAPPAIIEKKEDPSLLRIIPFSLPSAAINIVPVYKDLYETIETIEKTAINYQDNFAENLYNQMIAKRRNKEWEEACIFGDKKTEKRNAEFTVSRVNYRRADSAEIETVERFYERDAKYRYSFVGHPSEDFVISSMVSHGNGTLCVIDFIGINIESNNRVIKSIKPGSKFIKAK